MIDPIGNIFGILAIGNDRNGRAFFCGSHLDSQPEAGKFDGALGVVYACVGAKFLTKLIENKEFAPAFDYFVVCCWTAEEGARFQPSLIGSRVYSGELSLEDAWKLEDSSGIFLKDLLESTGYLGASLPPKPSQYLEVHIEQGPQLENNNKAVGLVETSWGAEKLRVKITGRADHTGPRLFRILCQRKNTRSIRSQIECSIKPAFKEDGQLR